MRDTKIWVSDGLIPEKLYVDRSIESIYERLKLNISITISAETNVQETIKKIQDMKTYMSDEQCIYLNLLDEQGQLRQAAIEKMIAVHSPFAGIDGAEVAIDSCIMCFAGATITDIEHIFPNGTVRNCPYIPYTRSMNNIPKEDYCKVYCPHKK
jgi:hypothetical protein